MRGGTLQLEDLSRRYGKVRALDRLNLEIPAGSFVTLLGPSGCGKSTTLNLIAGLDRPDGGRVLLAGKDITRTPPNERHMAMVFQNYALYPHMTAFDNVAFGLKLQGRPKDEIKRRVDAVAGVLGIGLLLARRPGQLSGGQQQRVALARALVKDPEVFLLDEPFSNLDAALRSRMRTEVKHLHIELGTTSVFVTHDQEEAMTLSDWIAVMRDGQIVQFGAQREIYARPADLYVATFVGKPRMSILDGALHVTDGVAEFVAEGLRLRLAPAASLGLGGGLPPSVKLGVRAEDVSVMGEGAAPTGPCVDATVGLLEPIGSDTFVELRVGEHVLVGRVAPDAPLVLGQPVRAGVSVDRIHLFDGESGRRLN